MLPALAPYILKGLADAERYPYTADLRENRFVPKPSHVCLMAREQDFFSAFSMLSPNIRQI
jgi:hypothetical protein